MLFSSLEFLYVFLPLTLGLYFLVPFRWRNGVLLSMSLLFYAYGEPVYVFLMMGTIGANYVFGRLIGVGRKPRLWLWIATCLNVGLLFFFKYAGMLIPALVELPLPVGISFYTFQALSYIFDVFRKTVMPAKDPVAFGTYITLFPQLIAGPIVRYCEVHEELTDRRFKARRIAEGISRFCVGLSKKVLLANGAGALAEEWYGGANSALAVLLWLLFFAFQIYFDFSGYSDMAVGLGRILGFDFPENFRYPYMARSITDFWRRWHMTLSSWFREYVYIPLGGNRRGRGRTYWNLLVVWSLTGLWHGASLNYLCWGLYFFVILSVEKAFFLQFLNKAPAIFCNFYAVVLILLGWLIFACEDLSVLPRLLSLLLGRQGFADGWILYELRRNRIFFAVLTLGVTPLPARLWQRFADRYPLGGQSARIFLCLCSLVLCTAYLVDSGYNPFLYFRF